MGWRIVCIQEALRINYKLNSIGVLINEDIVWINLDEIDIIIIETLQCNTSFRLLSEVVKKGISLIICGENRMPIGTLNSIIDNQRSAKYNRLQLQWNNEIKKKVWTEIIKYKILLQSVVLSKLNKSSKIILLQNYYKNVELGDITNREGHAAKVYFNELFGTSFTRERNAEDIYNSSLNYMYQVIRSKISQEIVSHGYLPSLGIFHCSEYNYFGLADDIIEVYRPIIDYYVIRIIEEDQSKFMTVSFKEKLLNILNNYILFNNAKQKILESIRLCVISITNTLTNSDLNELRFPMFYE